MIDYKEVKTENMLSLDGKVRFFRHYKEIKMESYREIKTDNTYALFVNSEEPPHREIPLDFYKYINNSEEPRFFRLYEIFYLRDEAIEYRLLDWKEIYVKSYCVDAAKQLIDSMKGIQAFIENGD
jgi:hypothetical protein